MTWAWGLGFALLVATAGLAAITLYHYARTGVAPVPSSRAERRDALDLLREAEPGPGRIYELGCGFGGLLLDLARTFPGHTVVGFERSPVPYLVARWRARRIDNVRVHRADFLRASLPDAAAVMCYLMLRPMAALAGHLDAELEPGTPVVAIMFWFRGRCPEATRGERVARYRWEGSDSRLQ